MVWAGKTILMDFMQGKSLSLKLTVVYLVKICGKGIFIILITTCRKVLSPVSYIVKNPLLGYEDAMFSIRVESCRITPCLQSPENPILFSIFVAILHRRTPPPPSISRIKEISSKWDKIMQNTTH